MRLYCCCSPVCIAASGHGIGRMIDALVVSLSPLRLKSSPSHAMGNSSKEDESVGRQGGRRNQHTDEHRSRVVGVAHFPIYIANRINVHGEELISSVSRIVPVPL
jgi:hypothetical protein